MVGKKCFYKVILRGSETSVQVDDQGALCSSKGGEVNIAINMEYRQVSYPINILQREKNFDDKNCSTNKNFEAQYFHLLTYMGVFDLVFVSSVLPQLPADCNKWGLL